MHGYVLRIVRIGFPMDFFPVLFAVPRVVGWLAHWRQMMHQEGGVKIWRPRQVCLFFCIDPFFFS